MQFEPKGRILIIGLDGASPVLVERWQDDLPNLRRLMQRGVFGQLESVIPPRSIPAWYCLATGMNDYVAKPLRAAELYTVVHRTISGRKK